ncbi:MAG: pyridoxamine 5'-phosphate oxidase family protein [Acidimicrobiales bacterium]
MPNRRSTITMSEEEMYSFLDGQKTMNVATIGPNGWPHLVAMWYCSLGDDLVFWTFGKSQKAINLRRDPRLTVLVEDGETYETLRGVQLQCRARLVETPEEVIAIGTGLLAKYMPGAAQQEQEVFLRTAPKRIGVHLTIEHSTSWDHHKLGGVY